MPPSKGSRRRRKVPKNLHVMQQLLRSQIEGEEQIHRLVKIRRAAAEAARRASRERQTAQLLAQGPTTTTRPTTPTKPSRAGNMKVGARNDVPVHNHKAQQALAQVRAAVRKEQMERSREQAKKAREDGLIRGIVHRPPSRLGGLTPATASEARSADPAFNQWLHYHGVQPEQRVFNLLNAGKNKVLRELLLAAGLVENPDPVSPHWDYRWILHRSDTDWSAHRPWQAINSFQHPPECAAHKITTKAGLAHP